MRDSKTASVCVKEHLGVQPLRWMLRATFMLREWMQLAGLRSSIISLAKNSGLLTTILAGP